MSIYHSGKVDERMNELMKKWNLYFASGSPLCKDVVGYKSDVIPSAAGLPVWR